jgi:hypothetical protein
MLGIRIPSILHFSFAIAVGSAGWLPVARADFKGVWLLVGGKAVKDESIGSADYTISNRFTNSLAYPGYVELGSYRQDAEGTLNVPSGKLMYLTQINSNWIGFAISADSHPERSIANKKIDITSPTGTNDYPRGYQMNTILEPSLDIQASIEPGILLSSTLMAFVKVAYHQMDVTVRSEATIDGGLGLPRSVSTPTKYRFEGVGGGFGLRWMLTDRILIEPLFEFINFQPKTIPLANFDSVSDEFTMTQREELKLKWSMMSVSLGYQF